MTVPVITAAFTITYFAITIWLVRRLKLDVRSICYASVICALTVVLAGIRIPLPTGSNITCGSWIPLILLAVIYDQRLAFLSMTPEERQAVPYVILANQFVCVAWFSEQDKYAEIYETNKRMTAWLLENWTALCNI